VMKLAPRLVQAVPGHVAPQSLNPESSLVVAPDQRARRIF
jgi:hypothetical protein